MENRPIAVYLDSSAYSVMSSLDPHQGDLISMRQELEALADSRQVRFVYAYPHLAEMSPLTENSNDLAFGRTDLLVRLCQRNCMIWIHDLIAEELRRLATLSDSRVEAISNNGSWFPELGQFLHKPDIRSLFLEVDADLKSSGANRLQRRIARAQAEKSLLKDRKIWQQAHNQVMGHFPIKEEHATTITKWYFNEAPRRDAENALKESLRDPGWMMRWFVPARDKISFIQDLRKFGDAFVDRIASAAQEVSRARKIAEDLDTPIPGNLLRSGWTKAHERTLLTFVRDQTLKLKLPEPSSLDLDLIKKYCPGLSTVFVLMLEVGWEIIHGQKQKSSAFIDCIHAVSAPYVDVFHADKRIAPHLKRAVGERCIVISRLDEVLPAIVTQLSK